MRVDTSIILKSSEEKIFLDSVVDVLAAVKYHDMDLDTAMILIKSALVLANGRTIMNYMDTVMENEMT